MNINPIQMKSLAIVSQDKGVENLEQPQGTYLTCKIGGKLVEVLTGGEVYSVNEHGNTTGVMHMP